MARMFEALSDFYSNQLGLPESRVTITPIPGGDKGTKATLQKMKEIVWKSLRHPQHSPVIRMASAKAILGANCKPKDYLCEYDAIHTFVRDKIRWTRDARRHETLQWPARTLAMGIGDCDDKCLSPNTLQWVRLNGVPTRMMIKDLVAHFVPTPVLVTVGGLLPDSSEEYFIPKDKITIEVPTWIGKNYKEGHASWTRVTRMYRKVTETKLFKITVAGDRTITCTANHRFFREGSKNFLEVRAGDLKVGDKIATVREIPPCPQGDEDWNDLDLFAFGFWLADGCYDMQHGPKFSCGNSEALIEKVRTWAASHDASISESKSRKGDVLVCSREIMARMKTLGLEGTSHTKRVPSWVFKLSEKKLAHFLLGYFSGDGSMWFDRNGPHIVVSSVSTDLLGDVRDLLNRFGIDGVVTHAINKAGFNTGKPSAIHQLGMHSSAMIKKFVDRIGCFRPVLWTEGMYAPEKSKYPVCMRTIRSIEEVDGNEVYDLEVEDESHRFVAAGFLTHNSMLEAAMLLHVGFPGVAFKAIGANPAVPDQYTHVYIIADPSGKEKWIASDPTVDNAKLGWESPLILKSMAVEL